MADDKLKIYSKALDDIKAELTLKRTELATFARQTVDNLNADIPKLRTEVATIKAEITRLDAILKDKKAKADTEHTSCIVHYNALEDRLKKDYQDKSVKLNYKESDLVKRENAYKANLVNLEEREVALKSGIETLGFKTDKFVQDRNSFDSMSINALNSIDAQKAENRDDRALIASEKQTLRLRSDELSKQAKVLSDKQEHCENLLNEASNMLAISQGKEDSFDAREKEIEQLNEDLNQRNVKLMADIRGLNARTAALDSREAALNDRAKNIKIAEAALVK